MTDLKQPIERSENRADVGVPWSQPPELQEKPRGLEYGYVAFEGRFCEAPAKQATS